MPSHFQIKRKPSRKSASPLKGQRKQDFDVVSIQGAVKSPLPAFVPPQLATLVKETPHGDEWVTEVKFDGYRMLSRIDKGRAVLYSRSQNDWTGNFQTIADFVATLPVANAWLDGEVVVLNQQGRSSFQALQNALSLEDESRLIYYVFDIPYLNGYDLRDVPLLQRKAVLEKVMAKPPTGLQLSFYQVGSLDLFYKEACKLQLEGLIAKKAESRYAGVRNGAWIKVKCGMRQEMVIGGFTDPQASRQGFGALHLGVYEGGKLRYAGKVGTGFDDKLLASLKEQLDSRLQKDPPFINPPKGAEARRSHWVRPDLVAEVAFTEWTADGTLRHPSFQGLRLDKKAKQVIRERPAG